MTRMRLLFAALVATVAFAAVPSASAQCPNNGAVGSPCIHVVAAGSSAIFQQAAVEVVNNLAPNTAAVAAGGSIHHFTIKGKCADGLSGLCSALHDGRNTNILDESATFWLVYVCGGATCTGSNVTDVWEDSQVDSIVGSRMFLAQPSANNQLAANTSSGLYGNGTDHAGNLISSALFLHGTNQTTGGGCVAAFPNTCDDSAVPDDVMALINPGACQGGTSCTSTTQGSGVQINTAFTDITIDDAEYGTQRALASGDATNWTGLGYCCRNGATGVGNPILSNFSATSANPVAFSLPGTDDPFNTTEKVPTSIVTYPVGVEPVVFLVNRTDSSGLGQLQSGSTVAPIYSNVIDNGPSGSGSGSSPIGTLFDGINCDGSNSAFSPQGTLSFKVFPQLREPLSGTMNTTEYSVFRSYGGSGSLGVGGDKLNPAFVSGNTSYGATSQESGVFQSSTGAPINPLGGAAEPWTTPGPGTPCTQTDSKAGGSRSRNIGTGEEVGGTAGVGGVKNVEDGIGYTFYSFANVSTLAGSSYGYVTLDGVDPIFNTYGAGAVDPGQPAFQGLEYGEVPVCDVTKNGTSGKGCERNDVWANGNYFPHIVDGTYRAWSILRAVCDTTNKVCQPYLAVSAGGPPPAGQGDEFGTLSLIEAAEDAIHTSDAHSVADILPLSLDGSFGLLNGAALLQDNPPTGGGGTADAAKPCGTGTANPCESFWGDANFARSHFAFESVLPGGSLPEPTDTVNTHGGLTDSTVPGFAIGPLASDAGAKPAVTVNVNQPNGTYAVPINNLMSWYLAGPYAGQFFEMAQGGDAGGCIIPAPQSGDLLSVQFIQPINNATGTPVPNHVKFFFTELTGPNGASEPNDDPSTFGWDATNGPYGYCGGGSNDGGWCNASNTGPDNANTVVASPACGAVGYKGDANNPFGYTCNPAHLNPSRAGDGEGISVTGATGSYGAFDGSFAISKFVSAGVIKAKVPAGNYPNGLGKNSTAFSGVQASVSAGCAQ